MLDCLAAAGTPRDWALLDELQGRPPSPLRDRAAELTVRPRPRARRPQMSATGDRPAPGGGGEGLTRGARRVGARRCSRACSASCASRSSPSRWAQAPSDAFLAAFRIPNLLRDLFAEGALSTAFVPTYVATLRGVRARRRRARQPGDDDADDLPGRVAVVGIVFPGPVVRLVATGFSPEKAALPRCSRGS